MKVEKRFFPIFISHLSDWDIISAFSYCNKITYRETPIFQAEFRDICEFFFDGNENEALSALEECKKIYTEEISKRHCN